MASLYAMDAALREGTIGCGDLCPGTAGFQPATTRRTEAGGPNKRIVAGLSDKEAARYRRREVGFIFQSFNLLPRLTVLENVAVPLMFEGVAPVERRRRATEMLTELGPGR